jgi:hypothetical protein
MHVELNLQFATLIRQFAIAGQSDGSGSERLKIAK